MEKSYSQIMKQKVITLCWLTFIQLSLLVCDLAFVNSPSWAIFVSCTAVLSIYLVSVEEQVMRGWKRNYYSKPKKLDE